MKGIAKSERGLTLLEVMIALAIVAIAMTSLLALSNRSIGVHDRLQSLTRGTMLAQQMLALVETAPERYQERQEQSFDEPYEAFSWRFRFGETPIDGVRTVTVTVLWGEEKSNEKVALTSFVAEGQRP